MIENKSLFAMNDNAEKKLNFPSELFWKESVEAIKSSVRYQNFQNFSNFLIENLPQNVVKKLASSTIIFHTSFIDTKSKIRLYINLAK